MLSRNHNGEIYDSYGEDDDMPTPSVKILQEPEEQFVEVKKNRAGHWVAVYDDDYVENGFFDLNIHQLRIRILNGIKYGYDVSQDKQALFLLEEYEAHEENEKRK